MAFWLSLALSWGTALIEFFGRGKTVVVVPYAVVNPLLLALPFLLRRAIPRLRSAIDGRWLVAVGRVNLALIAVNAPGSLRLHDMGIQYDRILHFSAGILTTILFALLFFAAQKAFFGRVRKRRVLVWTGGAMLAGVFLWEFLQYTIDRLTGSQLFYDVAQNIRVDFSEDVFFGLMGAFLGMFLAHSLLSRWEKSANASPVKSDVV